MHISHWLALAVEAGDLPVAVFGGSGETHVSGEARMPIGRAGSGLEGANCGGATIVLGRRSTDASTKALRKSSKEKS